MQFIKAHWKQILTLALSLAVGVALHLGKLSADQATAIGAMLALVGIHLAPITYSKPPVPPASIGLHALAVLAIGVVLVGGSACTPAEQQQATKIAPEAAACVFAVVEDVTVAPDIAGTIAKCGVTASDIYALVAELLAPKDAGVGASPDRAAHLQAWLDAAKAAAGK